MTQEETNKAAREYSDKLGLATIDTRVDAEGDFEAGAKWAAERMKKENEHLKEIIGAAGFIIL